MVTYIRHLYFNKQIDLEGVDFLQQQRVNN